MDGESIPLLVQDCLKLFDKLVSQYNDRDDLHAFLVDEQGRFRVWAGSVAAHRTGQRSLRYRLREAPELSKAVLEYLHQLETHLHRVTADQTYPHIADERTEGSAEVATADINPSDSGQADLYQGAVPSSSLRDINWDTIDTIDVIISCLMRISVALRNPARSSHGRPGQTTDVEHFKHIDIQHVRDKFPKVSKDLSVRLGSAITQHRQYLKSREQHHQKLSEGIYNTEELFDDRLSSTVATSMNEGKSDERNPNESHSAGSDTDSEASVTSYQQTLPEGHHASFPSLPSEGMKGRLFECPLCHYIVAANSEHEWRQHIFDDLPPYVCLFMNCEAATQQFSRRRHWIRHMMQHDRYWKCPRGCAEQFTSQTLFEEHLAAQHAERDKVIVSGLVISCAKPRLPAPNSRDCTLCSKSATTSLRWYKHVGHHMEQLPLFAIPSHLLEAEEDEEVTPQSPSQAEDANDLTILRTGTEANEGSSIAQSDNSDDTDLERFENSDNLSEDDSDYHGKHDSQEDEDEDEEDDDDNHHHHLSDRAHSVLADVISQTEASSTSTAAHARVANIPGSGQTIFDHSYRRRDYPNRFFVIGRVFAVMWSEPSNASMTEAGNGSFTFGVGKQVFQKIRRFIVIIEGRHSCTALRMITTRGIGAAALGVVKSDYGIVYTGRVPPEPLMGELPEPGTQGMQAIAIRVNVDHEYDQLDPYMWIDYGKTYTIDHNLPVKSIGMIHEESKHPFIQQVMGCLKSRIGISARNRRLPSQTYDVSQGAGASNAIMEPAGISEADKSHSEGSISGILPSDRPDERPKDAGSW